MTPTIRDESDLIDLIKKVTKRRGHLTVSIGDDACVLTDGTVLTADVYVDNVHFCRSYMTWRQIGTRCAYAAAADTVAVGARPLVLLVTLALPRAMDYALVRSLYAGIESACTRMKCEVGGGDIVTSTEIQVGVVALGRIPHGSRPKLRSAARPGHLIYLTGYPGLAEAGRKALSLGLKSRTYRDSVRRHLEPAPRLEALGLIRRRCRALIDTSDGIATDALHLATSSRVKVVIEAERLPIHPAVAALRKRTGRNLLEFVLSSGEDHELLMSSPHRLPDSVKGTILTRIGRAERGRGLYVETAGRIQRTRIRGYDHLA